MTLCFTCGQPMYSGRVDKQTCSPRCRNQRYRQRQSAQRPARGSRRLRQGLTLLKPVVFVKGPQPDPPVHNYSYKERVWVPEAEWDQTLRLLNQLIPILDQLEILSNWPTAIGYNGGEPPRGIIDPHPICDVFVQQMGEFREMHRQLQANQGVASRIWSGYEVSFGEQLKTILQAMRAYVVDHQALEEPFVIEFSPTWEQAIATLRRDITLWWFEIVEQTP